MRVLDSVEVGFVSGGMQAAEGGGGTSAPSHWWDGIFSWISDHFGGGGSSGGGLTQEQARRGCEDLGRGLNTVESGLVSHMYPGDQVEAVCKNAVQNTINWEDKSAAQVCEQVDDRHWNSSTRTCDP